MKYMGSKVRHAKEIIPLLMEEWEDGMVYIEPFVGGANVIDKIPVPNEKKFGYDIHEYLMEMWRAVSNGWMPPESFTEEEYLSIRDSKDANKALTGYAGFALSYGGKWFGGWRRDNEGKRDYVSEAYRNAAKQFPSLRGVKFSQKSVFEVVDIEGKALIYCDPPYKGTTKYKDDFDHERFYGWCEDRVNEGHSVFISEYWMPEDRFECVWSKEVNSSLTRDTGSKKGVEKLFVVKKNKEKIE